MLYLDDSSYSIFSIFILFFHLKKTFYVHYLLNLGYISSFEMFIVSILYIIQFQTFLVI